jgi:ATP/maltotriose-dependent transcriptional regulator MalT
MFANIKDPGSEACANVLLARLNLAQGNMAEARHAIDAAQAALDQVPRDREAHLILGITEARIQSAMGNTAAARGSLEAILADTRKYNFIRYQWRLAWQCAKSKPSQIRP